MIHFAPLSVRGISDSPYAIYDQLSFSPDLFPAGLNKLEQETMLKNMVCFCSLIK
jgi:glycogen debranching enzyme